MSLISRVARTPSGALLLAALGCLLAAEAFAQGSDPSALRARVQALESDVATRDQQIESLRAELREVFGRLEAVQAARDRTEEEWSRARSESQDLETVRFRERQQRERLEAATAEMGRLRTQEESREAEVTKLSHELAGLRSEIAVREAALADRLRRDRDAFEGQKRKLEAKADEAEKARSEESRRRAQMAAQVESLSSQGKEASAKAAALAARLEVLGGKLAARDRELARRSTELTDAHAVGNGLRSELAVARRQNQEIVRKLDALRSVETRGHALEQELQRQTYRIRELEQAKQSARELARLRTLTGDLTRQVESAERARAVSAREVQSLMRPSEAAPPAVVPAVAEEGSDAAGLRRDLDVERRRRETLETELARLSGNADSERLYRETWKALQAARAEVLVLGNRLADEQRRREAVETSSAEHADSERLRKDLAGANEVIVRLKSRLEAIDTPGGSAQVAKDLALENATLRAALSKAEQTASALREKAELAERLAHIVYEGK